MIIRLWYDDFRSVESIPVNWSISIKLIEHNIAYQLQAAPRSRQVYDLLGWINIFEHLIQFRYNKRAERHRMFRPIISFYFSRDMIPVAGCGNIWTSCWCVVWRASDPSLWDNKEKPKFSSREWQAWKFLTILA